MSAAISRNGKFLYVTCYDSSLLDVIDLDTLTVTGRVNLPSRPEAVAVGADGRVLVTTTGSGTAGGANVVLVYDPSPTATTVISALTVAPSAPAALTFPPPSNRQFLSTHSQLVASRNGAFIAGVNAPLNGASSVFVYETASNTILRSRILNGTSTDLAISDDGTRVMSGSTLFDAATLQVLAQQNLGNAPFPITPGTNFNLAANQGGSVFGPDGQNLYWALNTPPVQGPATASQLIANDPDNLLMKLDLQLPENLAGKIVLSADGGNLYALSDSGFVAVPLGTVSRSPLAAPAAGAIQLIKDPCGVNAQLSSVTLTINNPGQGRATVNAQLLQYAGVANQASPATAPSVRSTQGAANSQLVFSFNAAAARGTGTLVPPHDFLLVSPEAINVPDRVRVYENSRDSDARGSVIPLTPGNLAQPFPDMIYDASRQRIYIANAGLNRIEVFDIRQQRLLAPIKVGQLPISMALTPDGLNLYVANSGSESVTVVDPDKLQAVGRVSFPPLPFGSNLVLVTPNALAATLNGPILITSDGALWNVGSSLSLRGASRILGTTAQGAPVKLPAAILTAAPGGEYLLVAAATGSVYLYDATVDDFTATRQIFTPAATTGYIGPLAAGPQGRYFVVNGTLLNSALVPVRSATALVSAVAPVGANNYALFSPPASAVNAVPTIAPLLQIVDAATGGVSLQAPALEGPLTPLAANARVAIPSRTMVIDVAGASGYVLTASGLSIVPLTPVAAADRPLPNQRGAVNLVSYQSAVAANGLLSIFGQNLGATALAPSTPLPVTLGGTCVTLNNVALPLFMVSPGQINAQIPPGTAAGNYPLVVRSTTKQAASTSQTLAVSSYAPAVFVDPSGQIALFHADGTYVTKDNPANRDEHLTMYAAGLGSTTGGSVAAGAPSPSSPLAVTNNVQVFFGDPNYAQSAVIVDWAGLAPGFIGVYQLNLRIAGFHEKGEDLPVTIRAGGVSSPSSGPVLPKVTVN